MSIRQRITVITIPVITCAFVLVASMAAAQPPGRRAPGPPGKMSPTQVHQLFDAMLVRQAQNALALDQETHGVFVTRLEALQDTRRRMQQERVKLVAELQRLSNPRAAATPSDDDLKSRLGALQELETRGAADLQRAYGAIDELLTPLQQARFRVLEAQMERRKLQLVGRARQNSQPRDTPRSPPRRPPGGPRR